MGSKESLVRRALGRVTNSAVGRRAAGTSKTTRAGAGTGLLGLVVGAVALVRHRRGSGKPRGRR